MTRRPAPPRSSSGARLFDDSAASDSVRSPAHTFQMDGAARGNPGPASYGVVVRDPSGAVVDRLKKSIGRATNNVAEYYALIAVLDYAQAHGIRNLRVESDSELLVRQMRGQYKVKSADLRPLFERAKKISQGFATFRIEHVRREHNRDADALANEALDEAAGSSRRPGYFDGKSLSASDFTGEQAYQVGKKPGPRRIRAVFRGGVLHPLNAHNLSEGDEIEIEISSRRKRA
jgi:ribonuclease HI